MWMSSNHTRCGCFLKGVWPCSGRGVSWCGVVEVCDLELLLGLWGWIIWSKLIPGQSAQTHEPS